MLIIHDLWQNLLQLNKLMEFFLYLKLLAEIGMCFFEKILLITMLVLIFLGKIVDRARSQKQKVLYTTQKLLHI